MNVFWLCCCEDGDVCLHRKFQQCYTRMLITCKSHDPHYNIRCVMGQKIRSSTLVKKNIVLGVLISLMLEHMSKVVSQLMALGVSYVLCGELM